MIRKQLIPFILFVSATLIYDTVAAEIVHRERSLYSTVIIKRTGRQTCMLFTVRADQRNQSCFDTRHPDRMVFTYTRMMMASLLLSEDPASIRNILVAGLGGGTLPKALSEVLPEAHIDVVEIDPAVVKLATEYFPFSPSERIQVHTQDARVFTKRAQQRPRRYDLILLDAFNGDYIPEHLMTLEYLQETGNILADNGVLAANTFAISRLYDHESVTYTRAFGKVWNFRTPESANRVLLVSRAGWPDRNELHARARALVPLLERYNVPLKRYTRMLDTGVDWKTDARVLTDQYSPANLLQSE